MQRCSWSSRCAGGGKSNPYAACSRDHQPAPKPQKARPPLSASRVATVLAMMPGARKVTGETSVPSRSPVSRAARKPRLTHGSGNGSQARPTCGIWMRWSIRAMPGEPGLRGGRASVRQPRSGLVAPGEPRHLQDQLRARRIELVPAASGTEGAGSSGAARFWTTGTTRSQPSASGSAAESAADSMPTRPPCATGPSARGRNGAVAAGVPFPAERRRGVEDHHEPPADRPPGPARGRTAADRRRDRECRRRWSAAGRSARRRSAPAGSKASREASRSAGPLPTTARSASEDTISVVR